MPAATLQVTFTVSGNIYNEYNDPFPNASVKVFEIGLRSEKVLATGTANPNGFYSIDFILPASRREKDVPDIVIRVFDNGRVIGQSPVQYNIQQHTIIDCKAGGGAVKQVNEFDRLLQLLEPIIKRARLSFDKLEETGKNKDISFLQGETGEPAGKIIFFATAYRLAKTTNLAPDILYALLRTGFSEDVKLLLQTDTSSIRSGIKQAVSDNIISSSRLKELSAVMKKFNGLATAQAKEGKEGRSGDFKKLSGVLLSPSQQEAFIQTYFDTEEEPEKFWEQLRTKPGFTNNKIITSSKQLLQLNTITAGQPELAAYLYKQMNETAAFKDMSSFVLYGKNDWKEAIVKAKVKNFPAGIAGENDNEKTEAYAAVMEQLYRGLYPTDFFAQRLKADANSSFANKPGLNSFFTKNKAFNLSAGNIIKELERADFNGIPNAEKVKENIKIISRLHKLAGNNYAAINALHRKGLVSATDIVTKYGRKRFIQEFAAITGSDAMASAAYSIANAMDKRTTALLTAYKTTHDIPMYATHGTVAVPAGYHEMFGDGELCECEHCQSVYSPAAYFVDMLAFIKDWHIDAFTNLVGRDSNEEEGLETITGRRADLDDILLTCKNTNTPLPYIDLVNELLEKEVLAAKLEK